MKPSTHPQASVALQGLLDKYHVSVPSAWQLALSFEPSTDASPLLISGERLPASPLSDSIIPLFPWREERRFTELRQMVEKKRSRTSHFSASAVFPQSARNP